MDKKFKRDRAVLIFLILIALSATSFMIVRYFLPSNEEQTLFQHDPTLDDGEYHIIVEDELINVENRPMKEDSELYLPVDFIKDYGIDEYIHWDKQASQLIITTENKVMRMSTRSLNYTVNNKEMQLAVPIYQSDKIAYMPKSLIEELYNVSISYSEKNKLAIVDYKDREKVLGTVTKKSNVRYEPDLKSYIGEKLEEGDKLYVLNQVDDKFTKVRTMDGMFGYIETAKIINTEIIPATFKEPEPTKQKTLPNGKINLVWDLITVQQANANESKRKPHKGVTVLSPTWFEFDLEKQNGDLLDIADISYVDWAHRNGYQIWALLSDNYDPSVGANILPNAEYRQHIINQILDFISMYNLDGINLDFERIQPENVEYFLQFLRELSPMLKDTDTILSIDLYVPLYTRYYNRTEIEKSIDYACVMTYDEHTGTDPGPVASYDFVDKGITDTLEEIPREKILMGIPFYSRVFRNGKRSGEYGRDATIKMFQERGASFEWLEDKKVYYATYTVTEDGAETKYEVWLENERSLTEKMQIFKKYDLVGVASWSRALHHDIYFDIIDENLNSPH